MHDPISMVHAFWITSSWERLNVRLVDRLCTVSCPTTYLGADSAYLLGGMFVVAGLNQVGRYLRNLGRCLVGAEVLTS